MTPIGLDDFSGEIVIVLNMVHIQYMEIDMRPDDYYREIGDIAWMKDHEECCADDRMSCSKKGNWWSLTYTTSFPNNASKQAK